MPVLCLIYKRDGNHRAHLPSYSSAFLQDSVFGSSFAPWGQCGQRERQWSEALCLCPLTEQHRATKWELHFSKRWEIDTHSPPPIPRFIPFPPQGTASFCSSSLELLKYSALGLKSSSRSERHFVSSDRLVKHSLMRSPPRVRDSPASLATGLLGAGANPHTYNQLFRYGRKAIKLCVVMQADTNALLIRKSITLSS